MRLLSWMDSGRHGGDRSFFWKVSFGFSTFQKNGKIFDNEVFSAEYTFISDKLGVYTLLEEEMIGDRRW